MNILDPTIQFPQARPRLLSLWKPLLLAALVNLSPAAFGDVVNLVQNADFSAGMSFWRKPPEFGSVNPVGAGVLAVYRPTDSYIGPVVSQGIHATDIADKELTVSVDLAKVFAPVGNSVSVQVVVEFIRNGGSHQRVTVVQPANSSYAPGVAFSTFTGTYTFPTDAVKLVATAVEIIGNGSFKADNLSLSGPFTAGPVPVITSVNPENVQYNSPITLTGTDLGDSPGTLTVNGSADTLMIDSWSDTEVVFRLNFPSHGGSLSLDADGVMASQSPSLEVSSPHYALSISNPDVVAIPGQVVGTNAWLAFYNGYNGAPGIQLDIPDSGGLAFFSPNSIAHQGGSRLSFDTTSLSPGVHSYTIQSANDAIPGNSVPFSIDVRIPNQLDFAVYDPNIWDYVPVTETLAVTGFDTLETSYTLLDTDGANITSVSLLQWTSSDPSVLQVIPPTNTYSGPKLMPQATGNCTLTATAPNGFTSNIPVVVSITSSTITDIGFTSDTMDNSGVGSNRFHATTDGNSVIASISYELQMVNPVVLWGPTTSMDFGIPPGQAPGVYEFTAETGAPAKRSALLTVVNAPGTGVVTGSVTKTVSFNATPAGELEFYDTTDGQLAFSKTIAGYGPFEIGAVPPASYRLRFVPKNPGIDLDAPWYPNATSFNEALPVLVTADTTTPDLHFFVFSIPPPTAEVVIPKILSISRVGTSLGLTFKTETGLQYAIEYSESLAAGSWTHLDAFAGDGGTAVFVDPGAASTKRFYRIKVTGL